MIVIRWLLVCGVIYTSGCQSLNILDYIVPHFGPLYKPKCQRPGQQCKFDRNCCAGLECRMDVQDDGFDPLCHYRLVPEDYVEFNDGPSWKDYQEPLSVDEDTRSLNVEDLERKNSELLVKLAELKMLRKSLKQKQMTDVKRRLEEAEIELLKEEQKKHQEKINQEIESLQEKKRQDDLVDLERKEVNRTLSKQNRLPDNYVDAQSSLADKGVVFNQTKN